MTNEIRKVTHVLHTDDCVKEAVLVACSSSLLIHTRCFSRILSTNIKKKIRGHFRENLQKPFVTLNRFWELKGWSVCVNLLKKENLQQISFSDNV